MTEIRIPNHFSASLSDLDLAMVRAVPPGGNWKDIPPSIPSRRLEQIRVNFAAGNGSRSTYYGRLSPTMPSYTVSTYFNRPGNGCFIHFKQDRLISQREAARLQTFPDSFVFCGTKGSVNKQIGNAVPPLLAYQIATSLGKPGCYVDLFAGAGGLSLGFSWAGWKPIVANELVKSYAETYAKNIDDNIIVGDLSDANVFERLLAHAREYRKKHLRHKFFLLGGPPCQGFSTAGNRRTMDDQRNLLYKAYAKFLDSSKPDAFLFENVPGIQNMEGGKVFKGIMTTLEKTGYHTAVWILDADQYAVPQRRKRVFIIGQLGSPVKYAPPQPMLSLDRSLRGALSVAEAISDLPPLRPGQDGSNLVYSSSPSNDFQRLMRGTIKVEDFLLRYLKSKKGQL